jgi:hypothetical protein
MTLATPIATMKSEPMFKYQVVRLFEMDADSAIGQSRAS